VQGHPFVLRLTLVISLLLLAPIGVKAQGNVNPVQASVRSFRGSALIFTGPGVFAPPKVNGRLDPGTRIETGKDGRVVIALTDRGQITVLPNSIVTLKNFQGAQTVRELLEIAMGRVIVKIHHDGKKPNPYRLNSPSASIAVRGTEFVVVVQPSGETMVLVREGLVEVWSRNNPDNKRLVAPGGSVTVRPGGDISSAFPGPGSQLSGRARYDGSLGQEYQRSVDGVTQSSNEISPVFFSAFPDSHLDSLENPAYAAEFKRAEGRLLLLPSLSAPYNSDYAKDPPRLDYSLSPQLTFYTPIPGSRFVVGGAASAFDVKSQDLTDIQRSATNIDHNSQALRFKALNISLIAAYSYGDRGETSVGIGIDRLSGDGTYTSDYYNERSGESDKQLYDSNAVFTRTRLTFGLVHRFSESKKIGFYYRQGINSSDQNYREEVDFQSQSPLGVTTSAASLKYGKTNISTLSSELGARFRASLTRRLFYGVEGSYLYERLNSRHETLDQPVTRNRYLARRARLGGGMGFAPTSRILLNIDITLGVFDNDQPAEEEDVLPGNRAGASRSPRSLNSARARLASAHAAAQSNLWRNLFLSFSSLYTLRNDLQNKAYIYNGNLISFALEEKDTRLLSSGGLGWKFTPNLTAEYLFSIDHQYLVPSHSFLLRYTFNMGVNRER
jgi:hypothetical protein